MCLKTTNHLVSNLYINKTRLKVAKCFDDVQSFIFDVKFGDFWIYLGGWLDLGSNVEFSVLSAPPAALKTTKHVRARKIAFWTLLAALSLWENLPFRDKNEQFIIIFEHIDDFIDLELFWKLIRSWVKSRVFGFKCSTRCAENDQTGPSSKNRFLDTFGCAKPLRKPAV